ncbi:MAG: ATP-binding protein [candidate division KSB1 bacterium]|nr:ATP-binding protein [candidate division KSB1 bacterium]
MQESTTHLLDLIDKSVLNEIQSTFSRKHNIGLCIYDDDSQLLTSITDSFPAIANLNKEERTFFNVLYAVEHIDTGFVFNDRQPLYQSFLNGLVIQTVFPLLFKNELFGFVCLIKVNNTLKPDQNAEALGLLEQIFNGQQDIEDIKDYTTPNNIESSLLVEEFENLIHLLFEAGQVRANYIEDTPETHDQEEPEETALLFCTPDGVIVDTQEGTNALLGLGEQENLVGKSLISDLTADTDDLEKIKSIINSETETEWESVTLRTPDDRFVLADITLVPQKDDQTIVGYECYIKVRQKETLDEENDDRSALGVIANHMLQEENASMNELVEHYKESAPETTEEQEPDLLSVNRLNKPGLFSYSFKGVSQLLDAVPFPIVVTDSNDKIRIWNKAVENLLNISAVSMLDSEFSSLIVDEMQQDWQEWRDTLYGKEQTDYKPNSKLLVISKKADIIPVQVHLSRTDIMGQDYISILLESSEQNSQPQLCQTETPDQNKELLNHIKAQFASISCLIIEHLKHFPGDLKLNTKQQKSLNHLKSLAHVLSDGAHKLQSYTGDIQLDKRPVNIKHLIESIRNKLERFLPEQFEIRLNLPGHLPPARLDQFKIVHILGSLCKNAVDAMPQGGIIRIESHATENELLITVSDSGQGMDPAILENLFKPFTSGKNGIAKGLTLSSIKGIMLAHQGWIDIDTNENGSTVTLRFPLQYEADTPKHEQEKETSTPGVLVVDDDQGIAETSATALKHYGFLSFKSNSPEDAVKTLKKEQAKIQIVVIDNHLETCSGLDCARELLQIKPSLDIIFTSGAPADTELSGYIESHSFGWLQKPFTMNTLVDNVKHVLSD